MKRNSEPYDDRKMQTKLIGFHTQPRKTPAAIADQSDHPGPHHHEAAAPVANMREDGTCATIFLKSNVCSTDGDRAD